MIDYLQKGGDYKGVPKIVKVKPLGVMRMIDGGDIDDKIIAVPINSPLSSYNNIDHLNSVSPEIAFWPSLTSGS